MNTEPTYSRNESSLVYLVDDAELAILKKRPPILAIKVVGVVRTGGYTNPRLTPYEYVQFPPDGIWDFSFEADAPGGMATDALQPIEATYDWDDFPQALKGVRIHAETNQIERLLSDM